MSYYNTLMEDETIDPEAAVADDLASGDGEFEDDEEVENGYIQAALAFEQRLQVAESMQSVLMEVQHNNDAIVGVMAAMASMGIGGRASLHGLEAATDADLSYFSAMEEAEAAKEAAGKGIFSTITGWLKKKWIWLKNLPMKAYIKCVRWKKQISAANAQRLERATEYASAKTGAKETDAALKAANDAHAALIKTGGLGADGLSELEDARKAATNAHAKATARLAAADTAYKKGWNLRGIKDRLDKLIEALKPSNIGQTWKNIKTSVANKFSKAPAAATGDAAKAADGATDAAKGSASGVMKRIGSLSKGWWFAIAAAVAAVIGVCIAVWRAYRKDDPEGAASAEKEGEAAEQQAEREAA